MKRRSLFALVVCLLSATGLMAQGLTGSLTGVVTQEGNALPGVTVTVTSPSLQGTRSTVTNEAGGYSNRALPPGDYRGGFQLAGMDSMNKKRDVRHAPKTRAGDPVEN